MWHLCGDKHCCSFPNATQKPPWLAASHRTQSSASCCEVGVGCLPSTHPVCGFTLYMDVLLSASVFMVDDFKYDQGFTSACGCVFHLLISFCLIAEMNFSSGQSTSLMHLVDVSPQAAKPSTFRMQNTGPGLFSPPFLHIKNAVLLSLASHAAKPAGLWGLKADRPPSVCQRVFTLTQV